MDTGVYIIENLANGRRYVGSAVSIKKRWREHRRQLGEGAHHSKFLQRSWNKYGPLFFRFSVVAYCDRDNLLFYEQRLIDGLNPDYNTSPTAGSQLGYRHSEETRGKLRAARARNGFSPMKGRKHTEASKAQISASKKGTKFGKYGRERVEKTAAAMRASKSLMTEAMVIQVRQLTTEGLTAIETAIRVGCTVHVVNDIRRGRCFAWVKDHG